MSTTYTGNPANISNTGKLIITEKQDGDVVNAASDTVAESLLADAGEYLLEQIHLNAALNITFQQLLLAQNLICICPLHMVVSGNHQTPGALVGGSSGLVAWSFGAQPGAAAAWQTLTTPGGTTPAINGVACSPTAAVMVGAINPTDAAIWNWAGPGNSLAAATNTLTAALNCVVWNPFLNSGNGMWVAGGAGSSGSILTTTAAGGTGAWTTQTSTLAAAVGQIIVGPSGLMLALPTSGTTGWTSSNGTTWTPVTLPATISSVGFTCLYSPVSGSFVALDSATPKIWTSTTGATGSWTAQYSPPLAVTVETVLYQVGRMLVLLASDLTGTTNPNGFAATSFDGGATWKVRNPGFSGGTPARFAGVAVLDSGQALFLGLITGVTVGLSAYTAPFYTP